MPREHPGALQRTNQAPKGAAAHMSEANAGDFSGEMRIGKDENRFSGGALTSAPGRFPQQSFMSSENFSEFF
jgi:hypothetical protein